MFLDLSEKIINFYWLLCQNGVNLGNFQGTWNLASSLRIVKILDFCVISDLLQYPNY